MAVDKMQGMDIAKLMAGISTGADLLTDKKVKTKTSGGTQTQTSGLEISNEGRNKMISDALSANSGLAEVSSGQRRAGLYNSSTNQLLVNDLLDRVTSSVDRDTAKQVTNTVTSPTTSTQVTPARVGLGDAALGIGGAMAAKKIYDIFSDSGAIENVASGAGSAISSVLSNSIGDTASLGLDFGGFGDAFGGMPVLSMASSFLSGDPEDALASGAGYLAGNMILPGVGGPIGAILSDILPVGDILSGIGDSIGGLFGGGSVVCTELHKQGLMSTALYLNDVRFAHAHMSPVVLTGYRFWGIPLVRLMRRSALVTAIAGFFAINRAHYIASLSGKAPYKKHKAVIGAVINATGVPACYVLGKVLGAVKHKVGTYVPA